jgi:hypothetical protein
MLENGRWYWHLAEAVHQGGDARRHDSLVFDTADTIHLWNR